MKKFVLILFISSPLLIYPQIYNQDTLMISGSKYFEDGKYKNAIDLYSIYLKNHLNDTAFLNRAIAYLNIGDTCSYCKDLESMVFKNPDILHSYRKNCLRLNKIIALDEPSKGMYGVDSIFCYHQNCTRESSYELKYTHIQSSVYNSENSDPVYKNCSNMPEFTGGENQMKDFISMNLQLPEKSLLNKEFETVRVSFIVEKDGTLTNIEAERFSYYLNALEAIRIVKKMPKWKPGNFKIRKVRTLISVNIDFNQPENFQKIVDEFKDKFLAKNDTCSFCSLINRKPNKFKSLEDIYSMCYIIKDTIFQTENYIKKMYPAYDHSILYQNICSDDFITLYFNRLNQPLIEVLDYDTPAKYKNGEDDMLDYLSNSIIYPRESLELGIQGTVYLSFTINAQGRTSDIKILKSPHKSLSEESIRVVKNMPRWTPALINNQPTKMEFNMPIKFTLQH